MEQTTGIAEYIKEKTGQPWINIKKFGRVRNKLNLKEFYIHSKYTVRYEEILSTNVDRPGTIISNMC